MAITQSTQVVTVDSIKDVQGPDNIRYKQINCSIAADTGTTKLQFNGTGGFLFPTSGPKPTITFYMKASGAGTLPAVGDTINCVLG